MSEKCFCHLNGYKVKDADARASVSALEQRATQLESKVTSLESSAGGGGAAIKTINVDLTQASVNEQGTTARVSVVLPSDVLPYACLKIVVNEVGTGSNSTYYSPVMFLQPYDGTTHYYQDNFPIDYGNSNANLNYYSHYQDFNGNYNYDSGTFYNFSVTAQDSSKTLKITSITLYYMEV